MLENPGLRLGCREIWKNVQNETTKRFLIGNTNKLLTTFQPIKANFMYEVLLNYPKIEKFCSWNPTVKANKMLTFVLPTERALNSFIGHSFKFLGNQGELDRTETTKNFY